MEYEFCNEILDIISDKLNIEILFYDLETD